MHNKEKKHINLVVLAFSVGLAVSIPFVFDLKTVNSNSEVRGVPFDWLELYPSNGFIFKGFGFLLNTIVFYFTLSWLAKAFKKKDNIA